MRKYFTNIITTFAMTMILVVAPLLAFSEATLKGIIDNWLSQCILIVDVRQEEIGSKIVRLYLFGDMPESIPLTFSPDKGLISRISFLNHIEQDTAHGETNILVHPLANQRCPGDLCPETPENQGPSEKLTIRVKPITSNYVYQFRAIVTEQKSNSNLKMYIKPLLDEKILCRVEMSSYSNFLARQSRGTQAIILFVSIVILGIILKILKAPQPKLTEEP